MLPVGTILWAKNRPADHNDHLHVEPPTKKTGTPPLSNPGRSPGIQVIYDALVVQFGPTKYFQESGSAAWTHMGGWNRRKIAGTNTWSQHAWWNALDIGPYVGVKAQQKFYDFLTGVSTLPPIGDDDDMLPITPTSTREDVRRLQLRLIRVYGEVLTVDGDYGAKTAAAVVRRLHDFSGADEDPNASDALRDGFEVNAAMWEGMADDRIRQLTPPASSSGLNDAQVRQIIAETGRTLFVEKGQPVVIRGT